MGKPLFLIPLVPKQHGKYLTSPVPDQYPTSTLWDPDSPCSYREQQPAANHRSGARCYHSGLMVQEIHPASDELEAYSLGLSSDVDLVKVEEHLLICEQCRGEFALKKPAAVPDAGKWLRSVHITEDGAIFGSMHSRADGKWVARHWGRQLDGCRLFDSADEANAYLLESFWQMFSEHLCSGQCWG